MAEFLNVHVLYTFSFFDNIVQHVSSISTSYSIVHLILKSAGHPTSHENSTSCCTGVFTFEVSSLKKSFSSEWMSR